MVARNSRFLSTVIALWLAISLFNSCAQLSELGDTPLVMVTAARYNPPGESTTLLKFTIVYWADDISGLEVDFYNPDGDLVHTWQQPAGIQPSGDPIVVDGFVVMVGKWRLTFQGTMETNNSNKGKGFEDEVTVTVNE